MLHTCRGLPVLSVPSVDMTAVGTSPVAVPNLALTSRRSLERSETTLALTRLTIHKPRLRRSQITSNLIPVICGYNLGS